MSATVAVFVILGAASALLTVLVLIVRVLGGAARTADIERIRKDNSDLRDSLADSEKREEERDRRIKALEEDNARKDAALVRIGERAAGGAEIADLSKEIAQLIRDLRQQHAGVLKALREIRDTKAGPT